MLLSLLLPMFLACSSVSASSTTSTSQGNLKSVHIVFRHGETEPSTPNFYPSYPAYPIEFNYHAHADLTNTGREQTYKLGQHLRSHYGDFLDNRHHHEEVYARSDYTERARESLRCALTGLYSAEKWHSDLKCQSMLIEYPENKTMQDPLLWPIGCPVYQRKREMLEKDLEYMNDIEEKIEYYVDMNRFARTNATEVINDNLTLEDDLNLVFLNLWNNVHDDLSILKDLMNDFSNVSATVVEFSAKVRYDAQNYNTTFIRLNGGMLLRKIIVDMRAVIKGKPMPKLNLYAGQEFNIPGILTAVDKNARLPVPNYSNAVIIELREKNDDYFIRVSKYDVDNGEIRGHPITEWGWKLCPFEEFETLRQDVLPDDLSECSCDFETGHCQEDDLDVDDSTDELFYRV